MSRTLRIRRRLLAAGAAFPALALAQGAAPFPSKPIKIVVGFAPGGATDTAARLIADHMTRVSGQSVIVENRPGAGGIVAATAVAKAPADGYNVLLNTSYFAVSAQGLFRTLPYDPNKDFAFITPILSGQVLLSVHRSVPATNLKEFADYARRTPKLAVGSWGPGSQGHLMVEAINKHFGLQITHVAYKGEGPMAQDLLGGQISAGCGTFFSMAGAIKAGNLRAIAVTSGSRGQRHPLMPELPTFAEQGLNDSAVTLSGWIGLATTAGTPKPVITKLNEWIRGALVRPDIRPKLEVYGMEIVSLSPEEFDASVRAEVPLWVKMINEVGVNLD